jgi:hypothetical protein
MVRVYFQNEEDALLKLIMKRVKQGISFTCTFFESKGDEPARWEVDDT